MSWLVSSQNTPERKMQGGDYNRCANGVAGISLLRVGYRTLFLLHLLVFLSPPFPSAKYWITSRPACKLRRFPAGNPGEWRLLSTFQKEQRTFALVWAVGCPLQTLLYFFPVFLCMDWFCS
jgi:hypothetical protein